MSARGLRSRVGRALASMRLLGAADTALRHMAVLREAPDNRTFHREYPGFATPPASLTFQTNGHVSWREYADTGLRHAELIAGHLRQAMPPREHPDVLEWGCGCARILRHMKGAGMPDARLTGMDVDENAIAWCRKTLSGIAFATCGPRPPLPSRGASFDAVYHYSVLTHLSADAGEAWLGELARVLRDDGVMVGTTHGERYADMLAGEDLERFRAGECVSVMGDHEGRKRFLTFHPAAFVERTLLRRFRRVRRAPPSADVPQDLWIAQDPLR